MADKTDMAEPWADWNCGMDDAYACLLPRAGMPPKYYEGYDYACALNFEGIGGGVRAVTEDEPAEILSLPSVPTSVNTASQTAQLLQLQAGLSNDSTDPNRDRETAPTSASRASA